MPPEQTNEVLHMRLCHLEQAHAELVTDIKAMKLDVTKILLTMTEHNAKSCPMPGHCLVVQNEARAIRKDLDAAFSDINKMQEAVVNLQKWQTGLTYAWGLATIALGLWIKLGG